MITRLEDCKIERLENYNKPQIAQIMQKFLEGVFTIIFRFLLPRSLS
jgi:hypothetical protein